jgi:hypothetical protein
MAMSDVERLLVEDDKHKHKHKHVGGLLPVVRVVLNDADDDEKEESGSRNDDDEPAAAAAGSTLGVKKKSLVVEGVLTRTDLLRQRGYYASLRPHTPQ